MNEIVSIVSQICFFLYRIENKQTTKTIKKNVFYRIYQFLCIFVVVLVSMQLHSEMSINQSWMDHISLWKFFFFSNRLNCLEFDFMFLLRIFQFNFITSIVVIYIDPIIRVFLSHLLPSRSFRVAAVLRDSRHCRPSRCCPSWFPSPDNEVCVPFHRNGAPR